MPTPPQTPALTSTALQDYLARLFNAPVKLLSATPLGEMLQDDSLKQYGYGKPIQLTFELHGNQRHAVLHTIKPGPFGHEHMPDRAAELLWSHGAFNQLPRHIRSLDVGGFDPHNQLRSLADVQELFLLTDYAQGSEYAHDLVRLRQGGDLTPHDLARADALCDYLVHTHQKKHADPNLYTRRIRQLVGHSQCIMGLTDSYPFDHPWITPKLLESIEHLAVAWRWRLKTKTHRLAQVHGDFHPWNILFSGDTDFTLLDRSRGQWGEPADDLASITTNYIFESLQATGRFDAPFATLYNRFWSRYLQQSSDTETLQVTGPFIAFRALVMASPVWYPDIPDAVRRALFNLIHAVLQNQPFEPTAIDHYLRSPSP